MLLNDDNQRISLRPGLQKSRASPFFLLLLALLLNLEVVLGQRISSLLFHSADSYGKRPASSGRQNIGRISLEKERGGVRKLASY